MRYLCLCQGGNVRSSTLAYLLKERGHDALAAGIEWNSAETVAHLSEWAETIYVADTWMAEAVPVAHRGKVQFDFVVGPDVWGQPWAPSLMALLQPRVAALIPNVARR